MKDDASERSCFMASFSAPGEAVKPTMGHTLQVMHTGLACGHRPVRCEANEAEVSGPIWTSPLIKMERMKGQMKPEVKLPLYGNEKTKGMESPPIVTL